MSFYLDQDSDNGSVIKFGSVDKEGLRDDASNDSGKTKFRIVKTKNKSTWDINLENVKHKTHYLGRDLTLRIDP